MDEIIKSDDFHILKNWSITYFSNKKNISPKALANRLKGNIYKHSKFVDGENIVTSQIVSILGREIKTYSDSTYLLVGPPSEDYFDIIDYEYDDNTPIKLEGKNK